MRYRLSKIIPVPMQSTYGVNSPLHRQRSTWWQFRGHVFRHRVTVL